MAFGATTNLSIIITAIDKASGTLAKVGNNLEKTGKKMQTVGKGMTMGVTLPILAVGAAAGKFAMDFSDASTYANTMMGATTEDLKKMKKTAIDLAAHTGKSAADIMSSYYGIASAGYKGADADKILKVAAEGATGGFIEQEQSVDALIKVMSIYDKEADEARKTQDVMFGIVDKGLLTFDDLSTSFARASQFAVPLDIDMNEMGASLGFLSKKFSSTDEAATGLMALTRAFIKPSNEMKDVTVAWAKEQGLATDTTTAQMIQTLGMKGTLDLLKKTTGGNVDEMGKLIQESTGLTAALYLTSEEGAKELNENLDYLNDSAGLTKEKFDEASKSAKVRLAKSMESLKGTLITVGAVLLDVLLPVFEKLGEVVSKAGKWFGELSPTMKKVVLAIVGLIAAIGPMLWIGGLLISNLKNIGLAIKGVGTVMKLFTAHPLILAIMAVIAVAIYFYKNWDTICEGAKVLWEGLQTAFETIKNKIVNAFQGMVESIKRHWDNLVEGARGIKEMIIDAFQSLINWFKDLPGKVWEAIKSIPSKIREAFKMPEIKMPEIKLPEIERPGWLPSWIPEWQKGGIVPGIGPQLAVVHGGETIIPRGRGVGDINIYIQGGNYLDRYAGEKFAEILGKMLRKELRY